MLKTDNYISSLAIFEAIARDADYDNISYGDAVEWIWEVIELLGIPMYYMDDLCEIDITDYKGILPSDMHSIIQVRDFYSKVPLSQTTNLFYRSDTETPSQMQAIMLVDGGYEPLDTTELSSRARQLQYSYKVQDKVIYTEYQTAKLELAYSKFPIDKNGFPMIPDDAKFMRAVKAFIIMKLDYKQWRKQLISEAIYRDSEQNYYYAAASAQSKANTPDVATMETIRRFSSLLVSDNTQFNKSFKFFGK